MAADSARASRQIFLSLYRSAKALRHPKRSEEIRWPQAQPAITPTFDSIFLAAFFFSGAESSASGSFTCKFSVMANLNSGRNISNSAPWKLRRAGELFTTARGASWPCPSPEIPNLAGAISLITRITRDDPREILARCEASKSFCWIKRKADAEMAERIRNLNLRGIHFQKESKRFYPKRELAAQVLGYVGMDDEGLSGIEREYNDELQGKPGRMLISVDARRQWFGSVEKQPEPGQNIVLTIDQQIQYIAERELDAAMKKTHALSGTVIVENPHTGEILALANRPTFNPNVSSAMKPQNLKDHAVSDIY